MPLILIPRDASQRSVANSRRPVTLRAFVDTNSINILKCLKIYTQRICLRTLNSYNWRDEESDQSAIKFLQQNFGNTNCNHMSFCENIFSEKQPPFHFLNCTRTWLWLSVITEKNLNQKFLYYSEGLYAHYVTLYEIFYHDQGTRDLV